MPEAPIKPSPAYRKLTRMHRGIGLMTQLWLGSDHLLHVTSTGYTESYRRFYLRDIQTLLVVHTGRRAYIAILLVILLMGVSAIVNAADGGWLGLGITAGLFAPLFVWNHLLGAGCRVVVFSAVQQENIPSLSRLPKTRRILGELRWLIEAAQADLAVEPTGPSADAPVPPVVGSAPALPPPLPPT